MSFFQKLYEGMYAPINEEMPDNDEFKEQWNIMSDAEDALRKSFNEEQLILFETHQKAQIEIENMLHVQRFEQGFRVGVEFQKDYGEEDHLLSEE